MLKVYYIWKGPSGGRAEIENVTDRAISYVSISALPPEGAFQMLTHFHHVWPLGQKSVIQIFNRWSGYKIIKQNTPEGSDF